MPEFNEEKRGYSKEEVDGYIKTFTEEYQKLLEELREKSEESKKRLEEHLKERQEYSEDIEEEKEKNKQLIKKTRWLAEHLKIKTDECQRLKVAYEEISKEKEVCQSKIDKRELLGSPDYGEAIASALITAEISARRIIEEAERKAELVNESATRDLGRILEAKQIALADVEELRNRLALLVGESQKILEAETEELWTYGGEGENG